MSLNWNCENVENYEELCWDCINPEAPEDEQRFRVNPVTETITFLTMNIGIRKITEDNWEQFYSRVKLFEKLFGLMISKKGKSLLTKEAIKAHIGLHTNASEVTRHKFIKQMMEHWENDNGKM